MDLILEQHRHFIFKDSQRKYKDYCTNEEDIDKELYSIIIEKEKERIYALKIKKKGMRSIRIHKYCCSCKWKNNRSDQNCETCEDILTMYFLEAYDLEYMNKIRHLRKNRENILALREFVSLSLVPEYIDKIIENYLY